jgi:peptide-methionine (S)-S-oxide reductase
MQNPHLETATLGGGCFWCLDGVFQRVKGMHSVESGYSGGRVAHPTYAQICTGTTEHAEVVRLTWDKTVISYREILELFFALHDPTTLNRQGNDIGTQYRSVIFHHSQEQELIAQQVMQEQAAHWDSAIVTQLLPAPIFYPAEEYHQNYFAENPGQGYCRMVIAPKVAKVMRAFQEKMGN